MNTRQIFADLQHSSRLKLSFYFGFGFFKATPSNANGLLLAGCSGITPGGTQRDAGEGTQTDGVQRQVPYLLCPS